MAVERPSYSVELRAAPYEIRDYGPTLVARVHVDGSREAAVGSGFRTLAGYIFGGNQRNGKIAMTAPVLQTSDQSGASSGWNVEFMMPARYTMSTLPTPNDSRVHLIERPARRVAAMTFSGFWSDANLTSHATQLEHWVQLQKLTATSSPSYAYYDPPWTPWFLRTIEVLIDVAPAAR